jgi:hypothetical protein
VYETVDDPEEIAARHPEALFIAAADSSKSQVRKQIFTQKMYLHRDEVEALLPYLRKRDPLLTLADLLERLKEYKIDYLPETIGDLEPTHKMAGELIERHQNKSARDFIKLALVRLAHEVVPHQEDFQYVAELKYEVKGEVTPLNAVTELYPAQVTTGAIITETIGRMVDGVTPVTIRAIISAADYLALQSKATFGKPLQLNDPNVPSSLRQAFTSWLAIREGSQAASSLSMMKAPLHEKSEARSVPLLTVLKVQVYYSDQVVKVHNGRTYVHFGDAGAAIPYYRNFVGVGLPESSILAQEIVEALLKRSQPPATTQSGSWGLLSAVSTYVSKMMPGYDGPLPKFQRAHASYVASELAWARGKNSLVNGYKAWLSAAHYSKVSLPSQSFKTAQKYAQLLLGSLSASSEEVD